MQMFLFEAFPHRLVIPAITEYEAKDILCEFVARRVSMPRYDKWALGQILGKLAENVFSLSDI